MPCVPQACCSTHCAVYVRESTLCASRHKLPRISLTHSPLRTLAMEAKVFAFQAILPIEGMGALDVLKTRFRARRAGDSGYHLVLVPPPSARNSDATPTPARPETDRRQQRQTDEDAKQSVPAERVLHAYRECAL